MLSSISTKRSEKISRRVEEHGNDLRDDVLAAFGRPDAPRIGPTKDGSRVERWFGPNGIRGEGGMGYEECMAKLLLRKTATHQLGRHLRTSRAKISGTPSACRPSSERHAISSMSCTRLDPGTGTEGGRETVDR